MILPSRELSRRWSGQISPHATRMKEIMTFNGFLRRLQPWMFDSKPRFRMRLFGPCHICKQKQEWRCDPEGKRRRAAAAGGGGGGGGGRASFHRRQKTSSSSTYSSWGARQRRRPGPAGNGEDGR